MDVVTPLSRIRRGGGHLRLTRDARIALMARDDEIIPAMESQAFRRPRIAVLASGAGSTFEHLVRSSEAGVMPAEVALLITTKPGAPVAECARVVGVEHLFLDATSLGPDGLDLAMCRGLADHDVALVVLAGYLRKIGPRTLAAFAGRIINTHPAPLPEFGGPGMYGQHVHRAVLDAGVEHSAATVHLIDGEYDTGEVIASQSVPILPGDSVSTLQARVQGAEREVLVEAIASIVAAV